MKKKINTGFLSHFLVNRIILLFAVIYYTLTGVLNAISLFNNNFIYEFISTYPDSKSYTQQGIIQYFSIEVMLCFIMIISLLWMWMRPKWLLFLSISFVTIMRSVLQVYVFGWEIYPRIIFEWVILVFIGLSFSALVLSNLIRIKIAARRLKNSLESDDKTLID